MGTPSLVVSVKCLACGATYAKPDGRGTARTNPGCPECGYLGWSLAGQSVSGEGGRHRCAADPRRLRYSRSR